MEMREHIRRLLSLLVVGLAAAPAAQALIDAAAPGKLDMRRVTCEYPVRLTRDCSIWHGATRPIALGELRMSIAASRDGSVIYIDQVRQGPSHNGPGFGRPLGSRVKGRMGQIIHELEQTLSCHGISLQRLRPVTRGRKVHGYFVEFSDNAYELLMQYTVLESEHWLH